MDLGLKGKVALVTAASRGLGQAAATALAQEGASVAICARSEQLEIAAKEIESETGVEVLAVRADLCKKAQIDTLVEQTPARFKQIDILILNAGGGLCCLNCLVGLPLSKKSLARRKELTAFHPHVRPS